MRVLRSVFAATTFRLAIATLVAGVLVSCQAAETAKAKPAPEKRATEQTQPTPAATTSGAPAAQEQRKLVVYYLHGTFRCQSCNTIERLTKEAVQTGFADQIKNGRVEIRVLNVEEPGNEHFVQDYKLYTRSVILSDVKNGKEGSWKNLEKVWQLLRDESSFVQYIQKEVKSYL